MSEFKSVAVNLGKRSYDILIGDGLLVKAGELVRPHLARGFTAIVTDENVARHHLVALQAQLTKAGIASTAIVLPAGEKTKSFEKLALLCERLLEAGVERRDTIIALGGGVIGDLAGFAASILRRGISFIQMPTTLLAQVDSSVGGKTGINSSFGKNLIGAFHQPALVIADTGLLRTLPRRELAAGYAEVAKYGVLGDLTFFEWLETHVKKIMAVDIATIAEVVEVCCKGKAALVARDETETGERALLNLGHTFGHALEAAFGYSDRLLHGEAVAVGMVQAIRFSEDLKSCAPGTADRVAAHLARAGLPTHVSEIPGKLPPPKDMLQLMRQDKKAVAGKLTFILVKAVGRAFIAKNIGDDDVLAFLEKDRTRP